MMPVEHLTATRRLPRPVPTLPAGWTDEAGMFVHARTGAQVERAILADADDVELARSVAADRAKLELSLWEQERRVLARAAAAREGRS